jgi:signal transduction histidine kinase
MRLLGQRSLSVLLPVGLPPVRADLNLAKKALVQLVENAVKYSPRHEPIVITAELIGRYSPATPGATEGHRSR